MNKKRLSIVLTVLFLVQVISPALSFSAAEGPLNTEAKLPTSCFKQLYYILYMSLAVYKLDALQGYSKEEIVKLYGKSLLSSFVKIDLRNIDMGRKGWTRYYPLSIGKEQFIVRIFLTEERYYQPKVPVLYEASMMSPAITAQVLPGLNMILKDCGARPHRFQPLSQAAERCP